MACNFYITMIWVGVDDRGVLMVFLIFLVVNVGMTWIGSLECILDYSNAFSNFLLYFITSFSLYIHHFFCTFPGIYKNILLNKIGKESSEYRLEGMLK